MKFALKKLPKKKSEMLKGMQKNTVKMKTKMRIVDSNEVERKMKILRSKDKIKEILEYKKQI